MELEKFFIVLPYGNIQKDRNDLKWKYKIGSKCKWDGRDTEHYFLRTILLFTNFGYIFMENSTAVCQLLLAKEKGPCGKPHEGFTDDSTKLVVCCKRFACTVASGLENNSFSTRDS